MPVNTRGGQRRQVLQTLPLEPNLLVHVLSALQLHHGTDAMESASAVCRRWHERVALRDVLDEDPESFIGELRSGAKPYRFDRPHDAAFLPNGDVCIADCDNFRLQIVTRDGYYVREVRLAGGTSCPTGVISYGEHLFVVEHGAHQLSKLRRSSSSGHRHACVGSWGGGDGELRHPWGLAMCGKRIYVTDQGNDRICVFDPAELRFLFAFGQRGSGEGDFREPRYAPPRPPSAPEPHSWGHLGSPQPPAPPPPTRLAMMCPLASSPSRSPPPAIYPASSLALLPDLTRRIVATSQGHRDARGRAVHRRLAQPPDRRLLD